MGYLRDFRRCFKCTGLNHSASECYSKVRCTVCGGAHSKSLCLNSSSEIKGRTPRSRPRTTKGNNIEVIPKQFTFNEPEAKISTKVATSPQLKPKEEIKTPPGEELPNLSADHSFKSSNPYSLGSRGIKRAGEDLDEAPPSKALYGGGLHDAGCSSAVERSTADRDLSEQTRESVRFDGSDVKPDISSRADDQPRLDDPGSGCRPKRPSRNQRDPGQRFRDLLTDASESDEEVKPDISGRADEQPTLGDRGSGSCSRRPSMNRRDPDQRFRALRTDASESGEESGDEVVQTNTMRVCSKTLPIEVRAPNGETTTCLAILDEQSQRSFADPQLINLLDLPDRCLSRASYSLTTLEGNSQNLDGFIVSNLAARGILEEEWVDLPPAFTNPNLPDTSREIATREEVYQYGHIRRYSSHFPVVDPSWEVLFLLGTDCLGAMTSKCYGDFPPRVHKTALGFTLVGPVSCLREQSSTDSISVNRTGMSDMDTRSVNPTFPFEPGGKAMVSADPAIQDSPASPDDLRVFDPGGINKKDESLNDKADTGSSNDGFDDLQGS